LRQSCGFQVKESSTWLKITQTLISLTVSYINHGPFTSYAPTYDSSFANVGKEDSDLIYCFYGEEASQRTSERYRVTYPPHRTIYSFRIFH